MENYAKVAGPLTDNLAQDRTDDCAPFDQTSQRIKSFEQLKPNLLHAPILAYPRFESKHPFILDTEWSQENQAVGAVLSQFQDGHAVRVPLHQGGDGRRHHLHPEVEVLLAAPPIHITN
jgi:hypothetical protein